VVLADDVAPDTMEFRYLGGLDVVIVFKDEHASRVLPLAQELLKANPRILQAFAVDIPKTTILKHSSGEVML